MFVKPKPGCIVRHPGRYNAPLSPDGEEVTDDRYWQRCLMRGDVIEVVQGEGGHETE